MQIPRFARDDKRMCFVYDQMRSAMKLSPYKVVREEKLSPAARRKSRQLTHGYVKDMNLKSIFRIYVRRNRPKADAELDWFRGQPSVQAAIEKAAFAINSRGKRYSHQRRVKRASLEQAFRALEENSLAIAKASDFDSLHGLIDEVLESILGIGELYVYDTSLRIGAKLRLLPTKVYLHAGTRLGARALGLDASLPAIEMTAMPREFHSLLPHEIEDILCIFKDYFRGEALKENTHARSWCC